MEVSNTNKRKIHFRKFIAETLKNTVSASRWRVIVFYAVVFLQFLAVPLVSVVWSHDYPDTYEGLAKKAADMSAIVENIIQLKWILLLVLVFKSPAEHTRARRVAKFIVLLWSLIIWSFFDSLSDLAGADSHQQQFDAQSFQENGVAIYGKVVFASYQQEKFLPNPGNSGKGIYTIVAGKLSPATNGYMIIVQLNDSIYHYPGLKDLYHHFNDYTYYSKDYPLNIPEQVPDLSNCLKFDYEFPKTLNQFPVVPLPGKYVKLWYDTATNWIAMSTDSTTGLTAYFDSIPAINGDKKTKYALQDRDHK